jgi:hypothetical protein
MGCRVCVPQGALVELLEEVRPEEKGQDAKIDSTEDIALLFVGEGGVGGAVGFEEFGCLVAEFVLRGGGVGGSRRDLVAAGARLGLLCCAHVDDSPKQVTADDVREPETP